MIRYADLRRRPRLDEAVAGYERALARVRAALDREHGPSAWYRVRPATPSTGGHDVPAEYGARVLALAPWGSDVPIPDGGWDRTREIVLAIVSEHGFTEHGPATDRPGHRVLGARDPVLGAGFTLGSQRMTIMQVVTGCHLP